MATKRPMATGGGGRAWKLKKTKRERNIAEGSSEDVLRLDILALSRRQQGDAQAEEPRDGELRNEEPRDREPRDEKPADKKPTDAQPIDQELPERGTIVDVTVAEISSTGDGLGTRAGSRRIYVVPFSVPGDTVKARVSRHVDDANADANADASHSVADFVSVVKPSPLRDDSRIKCRYFASCSGCQLQMLDYAHQLRLKKRVVEKAYANFSNLPPDQVPAVGDTIASPLQYAYRTKLTPHFDGPPGSSHGRRKNAAVFDACPDIGFMRKGQRRVLDIEDCPIGTDVVRLGIKSERERMKRDHVNYHRGATILLRESTWRPSPGQDASHDQDAPPQHDGYTLRVTNHDEKTLQIKTCVTNHKATTTEYIGPYIFSNPAGSFFQNNNSILPRFTDYMRTHILPPSSSPSSQPGLKYLIDAYSGSGLFTITLASLFTHSTGIDIAADSIASARDNARLNGLADSRCRFLAADALHLFANVDYPPDQTVVLLDPPRKGCDAAFLTQLRAFAPRRVAYVSCNVHTQARDVGVLVRGDGPGAKYRLTSLVGFDFFPQTGHVEGVALLDRDHGPAEITAHPLVEQPAT
ncbi:hypothetical protein CDD82_3227 [Ophiocordyceps australis]|uniref:TRAM domain-containing protein n=1 Tax=Ophiocordyceps australis TaxID=1399860 RepID=A0A2C5ZTL6_9HYPO|nr:hypothetical protein CDD82_3227 [Ophiocordyceps australis]